MLTSPAVATTATFQNGIDAYDGEIDCFLDSYAPNIHRAIDGLRIRSDKTPIIFFDLTSIPTTATVSSAVLTIKVQEVSNCTSETVQAIKIEDPDSSGVPSMSATETLGVGDQYANWLYKNDTNNTDWSSAESNDFTDVDDNAAEGSVSIAGCPGSYAFKDLTITNMVQDWVTTPAANAGMFFNCASSCGVNILGRFAETATDAPKLVIEYTDEGGGETTSRVILINE
jgi:hypothetical protein